MAKSKLIVISIVEHIHQVRIKWVNVVQFREAFNNSSQFFIDRLLHKFDFSHVKLADSLNLKALADLCRCLALCLRQHNIDQVRSFRDLTDLLEVICACCHLTKNKIIIVLD